MSGRVLFVGGAGFIGRATIKKFINQGDDVEIFILDNESVTPSEQPPRKKNFYHGDVCSHREMHAMLDIARPNLIYWLAARQGYDVDYSNFAKTNISSVYTFFEVLEKNPGFRPDRIVLSSSQAVYAPGVNVSEIHKKDPPSVYGLTKFQQEMAFHHFAAQFGISLVALRYSIVLGAGQSIQSSETGLLRNWLHKILAGSRPLVFGEGYQWRDFVHIDDVAEANYLAASAKLDRYRAFNVGGFPMTIWQMKRVFEEVVGREIKFGHHSVDVRPGGEYSLTSDSSLIQQEMGWKPKKPAKRQVADFLRRYLPDIKRKLDHETKSSDSD